MKRPVHLIAIMAMSMLGTAFAGSPDEVREARQSLENARERQNRIVEELTALTAGRQKGASISDLIEQVNTIHEMQISVIRASQALLVQTFGRNLEDLSQADRQAIDQLGVDQRTVLQRWTEFAAALAGVAGQQGAPAALVAVQARVETSPVNALMDATGTQIGGNKLAEAASTGQKAADELARVVQLLESATSSMRELSEKRVRELTEIIRLEHAIRSSLETDVDWRRLRREQAMIRERTHLLTFEETLLPLKALESIRNAHEAMRQAETAMRGEEKTTSIDAVETALSELNKAAEIALAATQGQDGSDLPDLPQVEQKKPAKLGGMPAMAGMGGEGIDISPIAQIAADIAAVAKIRRRQLQLYEETIGKAPAKPLPANRQRVYAAEIPQLARRIELYLASAAGLLDQSREAMVASMDHLQKEDKPASASQQEIALEHLQTAEDQMRAFWKELFEALARISSLDGSAPPHGAAQKLEEKAKMQLLLMLMREVVRVGELMKQQDILIARTKGWLDSPSEAVDVDAVVRGAEQQFTLSRTALDILEKLKPVGGEAQSLPEAVLEAGQWMEGAADALKEMEFAKARERQDIAMDFLENAWSIMAMSMSTLTQNDQQQQSPSDNEPGESESREGGMTSVAGDAVTDDGRPWYWDLPPQARDAIQQSMDEPLPPKFAPAIQQYFQRLSRSNGNEK